MAHNLIQPAAKPCIQNSEPTLEQRIAALEAIIAWVNDPAPPDTTIDHLAEIQKVILWVLKQPWERDVATWDELVRLASKGTEKPLTFRQEVVTAPPVRDVL